MLRAAASCTLRSPSPPEGPQRAIGASTIMLRAILALSFSLYLPIGHTRSSFLVPGALSTGCRSR